MPIEIIILPLAIAAIYAAVALLVFPLMFPGKRQDHANKRAASQRRVVLPRLYLWIGVVGAIVFSTALVLAVSGYGTGNAWWVDAEFSLFVLLCLYIILITVNFRIQYDENGFRYRTVFRRTRSFEYQDIVKIWRGQYFLHIKTSSQHLFIDRKALGFHGFIEAINQSGQHPEGRLRRTNIWTRKRKRA